MKTPSPIPAIWVLFTPYLVTWVQNEYGTGIKVSGRTLLELRPIPGIREVLRKAVVEDVGLNMKITNSMSQQRFELFRMASGLQSIKAKEYVPDEKKGRFNGAFNMLNTCGSLAGQLTAGWLSYYMSSRTIIFLSCVVLFTAAMAIMGTNREHISKIYNVDR